MRICTVSVCVYLVCRHHLVCSQEGIMSVVFNVGK